MRELLDGRAPSYQVEKRYRHAWGHCVWGLLTVSLVRDDRGKALHLVSQIQDIYVGRPRPLRDLLRPA